MVVWVCVPSLERDRGSIPPISSSSNGGPAAHPSLGADYPVVSVCSGYVVAREICVIQ